MKAHGRVCGWQGACVCGWADEVGEGRRLWGVCGGVCTCVLSFLCLFKVCSQWVTL